MIQRRQTLWLLLAIAAALLSFMFPFVVGEEMQKNLPTRKVVDAGSDFFLLIVTGATIVLSTIIIFLFKTRKQQILLCLFGVLLSVLLIVLYILQLNKLVKPTVALSSVFPFIIVISFFMAYRDIRKDEKLVKSLDKLR